MQSFDFGKIKIDSLRGAISADHGIRLLLKICANKNNKTTLSNNDLNSLKHWDINSDGDLDFIEQRAFIEAIANQHYVQKGGDPGSEEAAAYDTNTKIIEDAAIEYIQKIENAFRATRNPSLKEYKLNLPSQYVHDVEITLHSPRSKIDDKEKDFCQWLQRADNYSLKM